MAYIGAMVAFYALSALRAMADLSKYACYGLPKL
jgi:hypothetical protein